jgi:hypothetical protein
MLIDVTTGARGSLPPPPDRDYGNYADGRYAWRRSIVEYFPVPVPAKGKQGLWHWMTAAEAAAATPAPEDRTRQLRLF